MNVDEVLTFAKSATNIIEIANDIGEVIKQEKDDKMMLKEDNFLTVNTSAIDNKKILNNVGADKTINDIAKTLEENIEIEVNKLDLNESIWEKISQSKLIEVVKVAIDAVLKGVLKKKFGINFSTYNDMKDTINNVMDGNLKDALKESSDAAIDSIKVFDGVTKTTIKKVKNAVIDKTIDGEKYEIINRQTKTLNRISDNCFKFDEAMKLNDEKKMKKAINAIKKDMNEILPVRETIAKAQSVLDKFSLWENKGKESLTVAENELIEKLNKSA